MKPTRHARSNATPTIRPDASARRAMYVAVFLCCWMAVVGARLVQLQTAQHETLSAKARAQQQRTTEAGPGRGLILDRTGRELAASVEVDSFFAVPREVEDVEASAKQLARALGVDAAP